MIVKIRTAPTGSWKLYDGVRELSYRYFSNFEAIGTQMGVDDFTNQNIGESEVQSLSARSGIAPEIVGPIANALSAAGLGEKEVRQIELWLDRGEAVNKQVLALSPVYVLNNEGNTIEKL